jgi:hypothetical protein
MSEKQEEYTICITCKIRFISENNSTCPECGKLEEISKTEPLGTSMSHIFDDVNPLESFENVKPIKSSEDMDPLESMDDVGPLESFDDMDPFESFCP